MKYEESVADGHRKLVLWRHTTDLAQREDQDPHVGDHGQRAHRHQVGLDEEVSDNVGVQLIGIVGTTTFVRVVRAVELSVELLAGFDPRDVSRQTVESAN